MKKFSAVVVVAVLISLAASAATISPRTRITRSKAGSVVESPKAARKMSRMKHSRRAEAEETRAATKTRGKARLKRASVKVKSSKWVERFSTSSFAGDITAGDITAGEDPVVRRAAVNALGNMNGTVVAIDPNNGRILAMVNQRLALSAGATPCSTIKVPVALAALSENLITRSSKVPLGGKWSMDLTTAMAHSNNLYFETVGRRLGFAKYSYYAHQFGLGEMAGWNIRGEHLGTFPSHPLPEKLGGVGKMCSFGESIMMTPLQLGAIVSAIANGGTLYYLQHPTSPNEVVSFQPKVKRHLDIRPILPEIQPGMAGSVQYGTGRNVRLNFTEQQVLGKTGTCSNNAGTRYGWFASYANTEYGRIVTVVFLEGGRPTFGPKAAELAGHLYRNLADSNFFAARPMPANTAGRPSWGAAQ
jgi:membrane carboxypeptidase/penicillin-binding protein